MNYDTLFDSFLPLLYASAVTIKLLVASLVIGGALALPLAICRVSKKWYLSTPAHLYIYFFRGTPLLVQIFLVYYGLAQFDAVRTSVFWPYLRDASFCAILTFSLHTAAYTGNILRGAMQAVPAGQIEAARACGMSTRQTYVSIILPQAFRLALPAYGNEVISMMKGTSLASAITVMELTGTANTIVARTFSPYEVFIAAAAIYLIMTAVLTAAVKYVEHRTSAHLRRAVDSNKMESVREEYNAA